MRAAFDRMPKERVMDAKLILASLPELARGAALTAELALLSLVFGGVLALGVAAASLSQRRWVAFTARTYGFIFRSTPLLVQIFLIYYGLGQFQPVRASVLWPLLSQPYVCAILALTLNNAAYAAEIIRGAIQGVAYGQIEAARALGMRRSLTYRRIILPQALRSALPAYGNEVVQMVQATALASTITLMELTGTARAIAARTFQPVEAFMIAGAIYLAFNFMAVQAVRAAERRFAATPPS
jgi:octopine/nopaline transport system permease protein